MYDNNFDCQRAFWRFLLCHCSAPHEEEGDQEPEQEAGDHLVECMTPQDESGGAHQSGNDKQTHEHEIGIRAFHEIGHRHGTANESPHTEHVGTDLPGEGDQDGNDHDCDGGGHDHQEPHRHAYPEIINDHGGVGDERDQVWVNAFSPVFKREVGYDFHAIEHEDEQSGNRKGK